MATGAWGALVLVLGCALGACRSGSSAGLDPVQPAGPAAGAPALPAPGASDAGNRDGGPRSVPPAAADGSTSASDGGAPADARTREDGGDSELPSGPTVALSSGALEGTLAGKTRAFLGVPYAQPPLGALRFAPPKPVAAWSGVRAAVEPGPACIQPAMTVSLRTQQPIAESEDCLTLNVYAPERPPAGGAPVMVFIHGGGGNTGTGSDYDGRYLSEAGDVVVVTLNYRLGTLAWLVSAELDAESATTSGNLGLRDQQLALRWVQENITAFGGDPGQVTLFGESHGASCVCMHMFARGSETLAARYIMESGGCVGSAVMPGTRAGMEKLSQELSDALCPERADALACLRSLNPKQVAGWKSAAGMAGDVSLENQQGPYIDGELIPGLPKDLLREGKYHRAPILLGSNLRETHFLASEFFRAQNKWPLVNDGLELTIGLLAMYPQDWAAIVEHYGAPAADADANEVMVAVMDDSWMQCPARALAQGAAAHGDAVYMYSFELPPAVHTLELDYVFGDPAGPFSKLFAGAQVPPDPELVAQVQGYWTRFARSGDPNADGAPEWPAYDAAGRRQIALNHSITAGEASANESDCDFWLTTYAGGR